MKSKPLIDERLILAAAIFPPAYFIALMLVERYNIDIGHLGQAIVELITIPTLIIPVVICVYSVVSMISGKRISIYLLSAALCSVICSVIVIRSLIIGQSGG